MADNLTKDNSRNDSGAQRENPLRAWRLGLGLDGKRAAEMLWVSEPTYSRWERRVYPAFIPSLSVRAVHEITGIPLEELRPDLYVAN